jgi:recombination protein RecT
MPDPKSLTTKEDPIYKMLASYKVAIASVLPKHLTPEKFLRVAYQVINKTPKLKQCSSLSLINAIIEASILGLEIGRTAHLIPFGKEAVLVVDYKGLIELAQRSEKVESTPLKAVYENDIFDYAEGTNRYITHKPARENRGKLVAAYAIINFKGGGYDFEVVLPEDIEVTKKRSPGAKQKDSPWNTEDEWQMWAKTAMRRLAKRIPQSPELQKAAYLEELVEAGLKQNLSHVTEVIDADFKSVEAPESNTEQVKENLDKKLEELKNTNQTSKHIYCPDADKEVMIERCGACDKKQGCPSWE